MNRARRLPLCVATAAALVAAAPPAGHAQTQPAQTKPAQTKPAQTKPAPTSPTQTPPAPTSPAVPQQTPAQMDFLRATVEWNSFNFTLARSLAEQALTGELHPKDRERAAALLSAAEAFIRPITLTITPDSALVQFDGRPLESRAAKPGAAAGDPPRMVAGTAAPADGQKLPAARVVVEIDGYSQQALLEGKRHQWTFSAKGYRTRTVKLYADERGPGQLAVDLCPAEADLEAFKNRPALYDSLVKTNPSLARWKSDATYRAACLLEEAVEAREQKQLSKALSLAMESLAAQERAAALYEVGNCHYDAREYLSAYKYYRAAQARGLTAAQARLVSEREGEILSNVTRLTLQLSPEDAAIQIDGRPLELHAFRQEPGGEGEWVFRAGTADMGSGTSVDKRRITVLLEHGTHRLVFTHREYQPLEMYHGAVGASADLDVKLADQNLRVAGYAIGGVGLAALGVSAAFGVHMLSLRDTLQSECRRGGCTPEARGIREDANRWATATTVTFTGGLLAAAAGVLLVTVPFLSSSYHTADVGRASSLSLKVAGPSLSLEGTW